MITTLLVAALVTQATAYRIEPAVSQAGFDLKATGHTVHGSTKSVTGDIRVVPEDADALTLSGTIAIGAASLATGNDRRDTTMHSKSLLVSSFPTIDFQPARFTPSGPGASPGSVTGVLSGRLTIRGQTKAQTMTVTLAPEGDRIVASGTFDVAWLEFGVPDPSFFVVRVEKIAHAHFSATFVPVP